MRATLFLAGLLLLLISGAGRLAADSGDSSPISFLSSSDQQKFMLARSRMLANHPELQAEGEDLRRQAIALRGVVSTPEQQAGLQGQMQKYQQDIRLALLKEDPSLGPILEQIDQHIAQARAGSSGPKLPSLSQPLEAPKGTNALATPGVPAPSSSDAPSVP